MTTFTCDTITCKDEKSFGVACAENARMFAAQAHAHGPVDCVFHVNKQPVKHICFVLETDVVALRAEVARLRAENEALEKEKSNRIQWECHRGND